MALGLRESRKVHFFLQDKGILSMFLGIFFILAMCHVCLPTAKRIQTPFVGEKLCDGRDQRCKQQRGPVTYGCGRGDLEKHSNSPKITFCKQQTWPWGSQCSLYVFPRQSGLTLGKEGHSFLCHGREWLKTERCFEDTKRRWWQKEGEQRGSWHRTRGAEQTKTNMTPAQETDEVKRSFQGCFGC